MSEDELKALVRTVPGFPKPGILFRDITTLIADPAGLADVADKLAERAETLAVSAIAGVEARGFIFGAALAVKLGLGFIPVRKAGKLPVAVLGEDYALEYGSARLELDPTIVQPGQHVLLVDDLLATGGTALAAARLLRRAGAHCEHSLFVIDLPELGGAQALHREGIAAQALMTFAGH